MRVDEGRKGCFSRDKKMKARTAVGTKEKSLLSALAPELRLGKDNTERESVEKIDGVGPLRSRKEEYNKVQKGQKEEAHDLVQLRVATR